MAIGFIKKVFTFGKGKPAGEPSADAGKVAVPTEVEVSGSDPGDVAALLGRPMRAPEPAPGPAPVAVQTSRELGDTAPAVDDTGAAKTAPGMTDAAQAPAATMPDARNAAASDRLLEEAARADKGGHAPTVAGNPVLPEEIDTGAGPSPDIADNMARQAGAASPPSGPSDHFPLKGGDRQNPASAAPTSTAEAAGAVEAKHPDSAPLSTPSSETGQQASPELISPPVAGSEGRVETRGSTQPPGRAEGGEPPAAPSQSVSPEQTTAPESPSASEGQDPAAGLPPPVGGMAGRPGGEATHPQPQQPADISHGHIDAPAEAQPALPKGFSSRASTPVEPVAAEPEVQQSWFQRLKAGLYRTSSQLSGQISALFTKRKLDEETLQDLEDLLIQADLGVETAMRIADTLSSERYGKDVTGEDVSKIMATEITKVLKPVARPLELDLSHKPHVILVVGVNGTGKTTTIGKLAAKLSGSGLKVMLAAGDTFRAAAIEQLKIWADRTGSGFLGTKLGADAAGLAFEAFKQAQAEKSDVLIIDTAGRLQNKTELMAELEKIVRVLGKLDPDAPHTVLQTLDATTGQNAMNQVEIFRNVAGVSGLIMTKLDGTARGGILVAIAAKHKLPVYFIGVGEGVDDLEPFEAEDFAEAIAGIPH